MGKLGLTFAVWMTMATVFSAAGARAEVYVFDFQSFDGQLTLTGTMTVDANDQVTAMTGAFSGSVVQTISGMAVNPFFPNQATSPDGMFYYDNLFINGNPTLDVDGVLFTTFENPGGYWNLWGNSPGNYSLYESASGGYPVAETGNLTVTAVPEPAAWALMIVGFGALAFAGRRQRRSRAASAAA